MNSPGNALKLSIPCTAKYSRSRKQSFVRSDIDQPDWEPDFTIAPVKRIMSLKDPFLKMSKSEPDSHSRIHLTDTPDEISKKIRLALTDSISGVSYNPSARPGISNLLAIMSHLKGQESPEALAQRHQSLTLLELKDLVTTTVSDHFHEFRVTYSDLLRDENIRYLDKIAEMGAQKARDQANVMLQKVRYAIGLA